MIALAAEPAIEPYEVFAIKYAEADALPPGKVQIGMDPHHSPIDMANYIWLIRRGEETIVVDTGFDHNSGAKRGRRLLRSPTEPLRQLGVDPTTVKNLIVTHLHYDHFGNSDLFSQRHIPLARQGDSVRHRPVHAPRFLPRHV